MIQKMKRENAPGRPWTVVVSSTTGRVLRVMLLSFRGSPSLTIGSSACTARTSSTTCARPAGGSHSYGPTTRSAALRRCRSGRSRARRRPRCRCPSSPRGTPSATSGRPSRGAPGHPWHSRSRGCAGARRRGGAADPHVCGLRRRVGVRVDPDVRRALVAEGRRHGRGEPVVQVLRAVRRDIDEREVGLGVERAGQPLVGLGDRAGHDKREVLLLAARVNDGSAAGAVTWIEYTPAAGAAMSICCTLLLLRSPGAGGGGRTPRGRRD